MSKITLCDFVDEALLSGAITRSRVERLQRDIVPDGLMHRDDVDMLLALDRVATKKCAAWEDFLVQAVVEFVVWTSRPTGVIDREKATWLVASLGAGIGPNALATRIAFEVVCEADRADEVLVAFAMETRGGEMSKPALVEAALAA